MGSSKAGTWIFGILIYYVAFFLILTLLVYGKSELLGGTDPNIQYTDPGFSERYKPHAEGCVGDGDAKYFLNTIRCMNLDANDNFTCAHIKDCTWADAVNFFNVTIINAGCEGFVNFSYYGIAELNSDYCKTASLQSKDMCRIFRCNWVNSSSVSSQQQDAITKNSMASVFEIIGWVLTFDAQLGLGSFTWIFSMIFFYVEFIVLLVAIYYSIPFLHGG